MSRFLHLVELCIPLGRRFSSSLAAITERRVVLVGVTEEGITGWGEAAPYPAYTPETVEDVWESLTGSGAGVLDGPCSELPATANAAVEQAQADLAARRDGVPLWSYLGGTGQPSTACAAIGLEESPDLLVVRVGRMIEAGARQVKIKIEPGRDVDHLRTVRERFPGLTVAADANVSYRSGDPLPAELDDLGLAYLEQPLPARDLEGHAGLRRCLATPICLDETATTAAAVERIIEEGAADLVSLKPGILGPAATLRSIEMLSSAGIGVKVGGLVETSVGRAHALALASRPSVSYTDLIPPLWLLAADPSPHAWEVVDGRLFPLDERGMEVSTGEAPMSGHVRRTAGFEEGRHSTLRRG